MTLLYLLLTPHAFACDTDGDGYSAPGGCAPPSGYADCDDADSTIHPNATEVGLDGVDQDCDLLDGIRRHFMDGFTSTSAWTTAGSVSTSGGNVTITGSGSSISLTADQTILTGRPRLNVDIEPGASGANCEVEITTAPYGGGAPSTANHALNTLSGVQQVGFPPTVKTPLVLTDLIFRCNTAAHTRTLDWITIQNGDPEWPPGEDVDLSWSDVRMADGGASNTVVIGVDGVYVGTDEGGLFWWDGYDWYPLTDAGTALWAAYDQAVWDVFPIDTNGDDSTDALYALTGDTYLSNLYGGLWFTSDGGASWSALADDTDGIAAYDRIHACDFSGSTRSGGRLLAASYTEEVLFVASHVPGYEDVYLFDGLGSSTHCGLGLNDGLVSSLMVVNDGEDELLLVGYKGDQSTTATLKICTISSGAGCTGGGGTISGISCVDGGLGNAPDLTGLDVRDLALDPAESDPVVYVADGGRLESGGSCSYSAGKIWRWDVLADTLVDVTENATGPLAGGGGVVNEAREVVGLNVYDSGGGTDYLYAYYPGSQDLPYTNGVPPTANPKMWRAETSALDGAGSDWVAMSGTNAADRRDGVGNTSADHWIDDQPYPENWAPAYALDGEFYGSGSEADLIVVDGFGVWSVNGALTTADVDINIDWTFLYDSASTEILPQTVVATDLAVGPSGEVWATASDLGAFHWDPTGGRGAEVDCHWDKWNAHGTTLDIPGATEEGDILWLATGTGATSTGVFHSTDGGASWCFAHQTTTASGSTVASGATECKDATGAVAYCGTSASYSALDGRSSPMDIKGLSTDFEPNGDVAFATFKPTCVGATCTGGLNFTVDGGEHWRQITGFTYTGGCTFSNFFGTRSEIALSLLPEDNDYTSATSHHFRMFLTGETNTNGLCGLVEVSWDGSSCTGTTSADTCTGTWTPITTGSPCNIDGGNISGVAVDPSHFISGPTQRVIVWGAWQNRAGTKWGGVCSVKTDSSNPLELVDPADTAHYYDIDAVLPHPWMDRTLFVQPSVKAVTHAECTTSCSEPLPFLTEKIVSSGWQESILSEEGLYALRGNGLTYSGESTVETLWYGGSGSGVHEGSITW